MIYQGRRQLNKQASMPVGSGASAGGGSSLSLAGKSPGPVAGSAAMLTNEEKTLRLFMEHDIVGLSIFSASNQSKYSMKINTLRSHLSSMDDHPIVKLKDCFREILLQYIKK